MNYSQESLFKEVYELIDYLDNNPSIIKSRKLYPYDLDKIYTGLSKRAAEPLPDGSPSPFSANDPLSASNILFGHIAQMIELYGLELNLRNYQTWINLLAWFGIKVTPAEYGVVNLRFYVSPPQQLRLISDIHIPVGYKVRSNKDSNKYVVTIESKSVNYANTPIAYIDVMARFNALGESIGKNTLKGEYSVPYSSLNGIDHIENTHLVYTGRNKETLEECCKRARKEFQRGDRLVTPSDYRTAAISAGAKKVLILPGIQKNVKGHFGNLVSIFVYPPELAPLIQMTFNEQGKKIIGTNIAVEAADVISLTGTIQCKIGIDIDPKSIEAKIKEAIAKNFNPPFGAWGQNNQDPLSAIATIVEKVSGVYAVPSIQLFHSATMNITVDNPRVNLRDFLINGMLKPWSLFKIENSVFIEFV